MALVISVGILVGLMLGLTGAGGSIFAVPLLILLLNFSPNDAMGIALGTVSISAIVGILARLHNQQIAWKPAIVLIVSGTALAPIGRWFGSLIDQRLLLVGFILLASYIAIRMWQLSGATTTETTTNSQEAKSGSINHSVTKHSPLLWLAGAVAGFLSGLFGVGGGFLNVPILTLLTGMSMKRAVDTSLLVIALVSTTGFVFHVNWVAEVSTELLIIVTTGSVIGILMGTVLTRYIASYQLQKLFAVSVLGLMALSVPKVLS
ncbi:sulfite exporter TauE/SafE family protein [Endozoicomonas sp. SM1973]|uniref:Probable membrane transporter protein n=1 Tax=Spartinivicinus marinus TaxID=2994442 RepID=A0A853ILJ3_9GAMM|nr:sulfite exporter TauE/SafE family protein [Spartinivicinus marinus]NYZ68616.1 sulfite exporter TauE/SafE family protein [Spartinivicinus marinus]